MSLKNELIKFVMEKADREYSDDFPIEKIPEWIDEFFNQSRYREQKKQTTQNSQELCDR